MNRTGRRTVGRLCHGDLHGRVPYLHDGGEREAGSGTDGGKDRQHGTGHTGIVSRKEQQQEIIFVKHLKERFNETKNFQRIVRLFTYRTGPCTRNGW